MQRIFAGQGEHVQEADDELSHSAEHTPQVQVLLQVPYGQQQGGGQRDKGTGWLKLKCLSAAFVWMKLQLSCE